MITCKNNFGKTVTLPKEKFSFRPSVYGIIQNKGRILLVRLRSNKKFWFPGGGIDIGESNYNSLLREIKEETGIENVAIGPLLDVIENFFYYSPLDIAMHAHCFFYSCSTESELLAKDEDIDDLEAHALVWVDPKTLKPDDFADLGQEVCAILQGLRLNNIPKL